MQEALVVVKGVESRAEGRKDNKEETKEGSQRPYCSSFWPVNSVAYGRSSS